MSKPIVFFDTNTIYNTTLKKLFGNGDFDLNIYADKIRIVIPQIVIDEIEKQKEEQYIKCIDEIKKVKKSVEDTFHEKYEIEYSSNLEKHSFDDLISQTRIFDSVVYEVVDIDYKYYKDIRHKAVNKLPPFEGKEKESDKGFKDAIFYYTVITYLEKNKEIENLIVYTKDKMLKESLKNEIKVFICINVAELNKKIGEFQFSDYFIGRLDEKICELGYPRYSNISDLKIAFNIQNKRIVSYESENYYFYFLIEENDIESCTILKTSIEDIVLNLINSSSFSSTHITIIELSQIKNYLQADDLKHIINAAEENNQIKLIVADENISEFFLELSEMTENQEFKKSIKNLLRI